MVGFFETRSYWQGGFTEEQQKYYEEHRLTQKGKHLWEQINKLYIIARNVCSTYNVTYCFDKYCCCRRYKHLPFQCDYNDNVSRLFLFYMWKHYYILKKKYHSSPILQNKY
jgi:hypothetical protein